jgi:hypothetical protein
MPDMPTAKFVQLLLEESEEIVLMEAMRDYMLARSKRPLTLKSRHEMDAAHSFLLKIGPQLYTKKEATP